jgi:putative FmdB family regulatory protein
MPIYAYRCDSCGHEKDVLRKLSDAPLTQCPECGKDTFSKQVTAAGFQLKGSGWYVTDFRGGNNGSNGKSSNASNGESGGKTDASDSAPAKSDSAAASDSSASSKSSDSAASSSTSSSDSKPASGASAA